MSCNWFVPPPPSSSGYPIIVYTHPITSNLPIKSLVARWLQTNTHTRTHTHMHAHTHIHMLILTDAHTHTQGNRRCELFYRQALQLRPNYTAAWTNLGLVLLNTGKKSLYNFSVFNHYYVTTKAVCTPKLTVYAITKVFMSPIAFDIKYLQTFFLWKTLLGGIQLTFSFED